MIGRDKDGELIMCGAGHLEQFQDPLHAEALAAGRALQAAGNLGIGGILLETDALGLKNTIEQDAEDLTSLRVVMEGIKDFIRLNFIDVKILHCNRICNSVAHTLAAMGSSMRGNPDLVSSETLVFRFSVMVASESASRTRKLTANPTTTPADCEPYADAAADMLRLQKQFLSLLRSGSVSPIPASTIASLHRHLSAAASTSTSPFSIENYLVTTCGLTRAQTLKASRLLSHVKSSTNPDAVLAFLSGLGLSRSDIAAVIASDPLFLCSRVNGTLARRIAEIRDLGLSDSNIARLVLPCASAIRSRDIASRLQFWIPLFGSFDELLEAVSDGALGGDLLRRDIEKVVKPNLALLLRCGLSVRDLTKIGLNGVWVIACSPERLKVLIMRAEELGVPRGSGQFKYALATVSAVSEEKIASRRELLMKALGCSEDLLRIAVVKHPSLLRASEENLRSTVEFLISEVGLEPEYIVNRPALLTYSLKRRLAPRYLVMKTLQDKGLLNADYCSLAVARDNHFISRYIDLYKDSVPGLRDIYDAACEGRYP